MITIFPPTARDSSISGTVFVGAPAASTCIAAPSPSVSSMIAVRDGEPLRCSSTGLRTTSAPTFLASSARIGETSNAMILAAPAARARAMAAKPMGPVPKTVTCPPGRNPPARVNIALYATLVGSQSAPASYAHSTLP